MLPGLQAEGVKLDTDARLEQNPLNAFTNASSARAEGSVVGCWSTGPVWPGWDALGLKKPTFCIEREAKLHKQAAGTVTLATCAKQICLKCYLCLKTASRSTEKLKAGVFDS